MKLFDVAILLLAAAVAAQQQTVTIGTEMLFDDDTARVVCEPVDCQTLYITKVECDKKRQCTTDSPWPSSILEYKFTCFPRFPLACGVKIRTAKPDDHRALLTRVELFAVGIVCMFAIAGLIVAFIAARKTKGWFLRTSRP